MSINGKKIYEIGVFLDNNLNFTVRVFTWDLANDLHIWKNYKNPIILSNLIDKIIQFQICEGSHNAKVLQLDQQHEVPKFQDSLIYYIKIHENCENFPYRCAKCQIPISALTPSKLKIKQCQK